ncbi:unnamed protein product [Amaranthus hypochondriacus]
MYIARHVIFDESQFPYHSHIKQPFLSNSKSTPISFPAPTNIILSDIPLSHHTTQNESNSPSISSSQPSHPQSETSNNESFSPSISTEQSPYYPPKTSNSPPTTLIQQ